MRILSSAITAAPGRRASDREEHNVTSSNLASREGIVTSRKGHYANLEHVGYACAFNGRYARAGTRLRFGAGRDKRGAGVRPRARMACRALARTACRARRALAGTACRALATTACVSGLCATAGVCATAGRVCPAAVAGHQPLLPAPHSLGACLITASVSACGKHDPYLVSKVMAPSQSSGNFSASRPAMRSSISRAAASVGRTVSAMVNCARAMSKRRVR